MEPALSAFEILMDGDHDIETAAAAAERVLVAVYDALGVLLGIFWLLAS